MERKIGEIFEYNGEWYQAIDNTHGVMCSGCTFVNEYNDCEADISVVGNCGCKEDTPLIFKKLEKVGEPYTVYDGVLLQPYRIFTELYINQEVDENYIIQEDREKNIIAIEVKQNKEDMEEKNEVKGTNVLSKEEWCIIEKAQEDWERIFPDIPLMSSMSVDAFFPHIIKLGLLDKYKEHSNSENIGKNLKEFDLEAAKAGKPVCTRDGRKARIICFDIQDKDYPIAAAIYIGECEGIWLYTNKGEFQKGNKNDIDLMMLPEKKEGWVIIPKATLCYTSLEKAKEHFCDEYDLCIKKIEWEE